MRKRFAVRLAAPVMCGAFLIGCGGGDEPRPQGPMTNAPEAQMAPGEHPAGSTVALSGCIEVAPGTDQYVLQNLRMEPRQGVDAPRDTTATGPEHGITEGSWVRLDGAERGEELRSFAGHRVTLTGSIVDTGQNTIGTAGTTGAPTASGQPSRAAGDEHYSDRVQDEAGRIARQSMADGTAATVRVTAVESTGDRCPMDQRPEVR